MFGLWFSIPKVLKGFVAWPTWCKIPNTVCFRYERSSTSNFLNCWTASFRLQAWHDISSCFGGFWNRLHCTLFHYRRKWLNDGEWGATSSFLDGSYRKDATGRRRWAALTNSSCWSARKHVGSGSSIKLAGEIKISEGYKYNVDIGPGEHLARGLVNDLLKYANAPELEYSITLVDSVNK